MDTNSLKLFSSKGKVCLSFKSMLTYNLLWPMILKGHYIRSKPKPQGTVPPPNSLSERWTGLSKPVGGATKDLGWPPDRSPGSLVSRCCWVASVVSNSVGPHRRQTTRLPHPWDSPGKNTGVGCHFLLQCMRVKRESEVAQSYMTLSDPMDCSLPGSSIHGIFQARVLEWGAIVFSEQHTKC